MRPVCVVITFYAASVIAQKNPEDEQRRQQTQFFQQQSAAEGGFIKQVTEEEYRTRAKDRQDAKILDLGDAIRDAIPDNGLSMTREEWVAKLESVRAEVDAKWDGATTPEEHGEL